MERGAGWATVHRVAESGTTEATHHRTAPLGEEKPKVCAVVPWAEKQKKDLYLLMVNCQNQVTKSFA